MSVLESQWLFWALSWHCSCTLVINARQRLNSFLHFSQRKTALSSRDELEGSAHVDILQSGQPGGRAQLPTLWAARIGGASRTPRAGAELRNLEVYFFFASRKDTPSKSSLPTLQPSCKNSFLYKSLW